MQWKNALLLTGHCTSRGYTFWVPVIKLELTWYIFTHRRRVTSQQKACSHFTFMCISESPLCGDGFTSLSQKVLVLGTVFTEASLQLFCTCKLPHQPGGWILVLSPCHTGIYLLFFGKSNYTANSWKSKLSLPICTVSKMQFQSAIIFNLWHTHGKRFSNILS